MYIALKTMTVGGEVREPGAFVPEAASWPNLTSWVRRGHLAYVVDGREAEFFEELKAGRLPMHLAPVTKPRHMQQAARLASYGALSTTPPSPSPPVGAGGAPPSPEAVADAPEDDDMPPPPPAAKPQGPRKRG